MITYSSQWESKNFRSAARVLNKCPGQSSAWLDRTAYRSRRDTITRVARVKATKHKANQATDEVRVENRNHGLAWSQNNNNRTVARLLNLTTKGETSRSSRKTHVIFRKKHKLEFKNHCLKSNFDWVTSQFSIADVASV